MRPDEASALRDEPACAHNTKAPRAGCAKPQPGATQGGCCLRWRAQRPAADRRRRPYRPRPDRLRRQSVGCARHPLQRCDALPGRHDHRPVRDGRHHGAGREAPVPRHPAGHRHLSSGGGVRLLHLRAGPARGRYRRRRQGGAARWGVPVVPVDCAGFYGNKNFGNRIAGDAMLKHVIGTREPDPVPAAAARPGITTHDINLIGEWNIGGEFWSVAPLFDELGPAHPLQLHRRCPLPRGADHASRRSQHGGLLQGDDPGRARAARPLRHAIL